MQRAVERWTVRRILEWTTAFFNRKTVDAPRLSAELLLSHVLNQPRIKLYTDYERPLTDAELSAFRDLVKRAGEHEPIAYLTGKAYFFGLELAVTRDVLIPRPDTETLVENVLQMARMETGKESPRVLDLCTGSGCIACAIAKQLKTSQVLAVDLSPAAVEVARRNVELLGLSDRVTVEQGDLYEPLSRVVDARPFDLIVANPPYIASADIAALDPSVKNFEPVSALDGGADGLDLHRRILDQADDRLVPGGRIYLEIAFNQGEQAMALVATYDQLESATLLKDYGGNDRVISARRK
ncbi:peptide chain release factor N(5)-glutamine methyltransferase [Humisphaera borealis]|uniref:Release factor glutamine methyltransferase n=1 Tax=Humisphaera borealis TaxID=2807512 RepID=A0A7M2WS95_9BACT|nr:peptide chain release factor N(5)-glutamine methyltransferase [Humisphaera borealis]QOV88154.1 peptide chain release factor N(5)-glutamine methyltransferase [Humisphaera borealis]